MSNSREHIGALILAGGRGERLGGAIKSELVVGTTRLFDRVAAAFAECTPILVAHGRIDPALLHLPAGVAPVPDLDGDYAGPLAGLAGAIAYIRTLPSPPELLVSVAVDTPFLPADYVEWLRTSLDDGPCAIASFAGQPYPTNSIWRTALLAELPTRVAAGTAPRSLKALGAELGCRYAEWPMTAAGDPFANINTPDELDEMRRRAAAAESARA